MFISNSKMTADISSCPERPWQSSLIGSREKLNALFYNESFSDLTITFPGQDIEYKVHRVIMAVSSSVFEGMLFGPLAIQGSVLELPVDNPEAFKIVLGSCYEVKIELSDIDVALEVYILADKYFMEQLRKECAAHIGNLLNSENVNKVFEFATNFNFDSLKATCFQALEMKFQIDVIDSPKILLDVIDLSKILLLLQPDWLHKLLESNIKISHLAFPDSRRSGEELCEDIVMEILKSNCCSYPGIRTFSGCVSAKVVDNICWAARRKGGNVNQLCLSFTNQQQAEEISSILYQEETPICVSIHMQCSVIPANCLIHLPLKEIMNLMPDFIISDVDDHGIEWIVSATCSLMPKEGYIYFKFPRSKLTISGLKALMTQLTSVCVKIFSIELCSSELPSYKNDELNQWDKSNLPQICEWLRIKLYDSNDDITGW